MKRVDRGRWEAAQQWELDLWKAEARATSRARLRRLAALLGIGRIVSPFLGWGDDWNLWWKDRFDGYSFLPDSLGDVLELGCGPFTNVRVMLAGRSFGQVHCSDPLARDYMNLRGTWLAEAARKGIVTIDHHPAEDCPYPSDRFDVTVMINVLDHVRDMELSLDNAIRVTKPGGILILGQDLTNQQDIARIGDDIGHPIRITHTDLDDALALRFETIVRKILQREEGRNPPAHYGTYLFAGHKKSNGPDAV